MTAYKWGAVAYVFWGIMHALIGIQIFMLNLGDSPRAVITGLYRDAGPVPTPAEPGSVVGALLNQHAWNLLWFGLFAAVVGAVWNWRNSVAGYWANLAVVSLADVGFIAAVLIPGYIDFWMGIWGPLLWLVAAFLTTVGVRSAAGQVAQTA